MDGSVRDHSHPGLITVGLLQAIQYLVPCTHNFAALESNPILTCFVSVRRKNYHPVETRGVGHGREGLEMAGAGGLAKGPVNIVGHLTLWRTDDHDKVLGRFDREKGLTYHQRKHGLAALSIAVGHNNVYGFNDLRGVVSLGLKGSAG